MQGHARPHGMEIHKPTIRRNFRVTSHPKLKNQHLWCFLIIHGFLIVGAVQNWPPTDVERLGASICFDEQGYTFDNCCDQVTYGPWGSEECFQGIFSYELCCLPDWQKWKKTAEVNSCDWADFRSKWKEDALQIDGQSSEVFENLRTLGENDIMYEGACCAAYEATGSMCWNHLPEMAKTISNTNISTGYASCCFDQFQAFVNAQQKGHADPAWLQKELEVELRKDPPLVRREDIAQIFKQRQDVLCRIRFVESDLQVEPAKCLRTGRVEAFAAALRVLNFRGVLPKNLDLLMTDKDFLMEDFGVPVFTDIRPVSMAAGRLIRFPHEFLLGVWSRKMTYRVRSAVMRYPWTSKEDVLFWRGGMTGKWLCPHGGDCVALEESPKADQWNISHWHLGVRGRAVLLQSFAPPGYTDIKFSSRIGMNDEVKALMTQRGWLDENEPQLMQKQFRAKYLLVTDDSDRVYWMATGNSLLFMPSSGMLRGCGLHALVPWQHFVPLKSDLSDAIEQITWAKQHDEEARLIAARGAALAREAFSHEAQLFCLLRMVQEVSAWLN